MEIHIAVEVVMVLMLLAAPRNANKRFLGPRLQKGSLRVRRDP